MVLEFLGCFCVHGYFQKPGRGARARRPQLCSFGRAALEGLVGDFGRFLWPDFCTPSPLLFNPLWPLFQSLLAGMATKVCFAPTALPVSGVALYVKGITLIYFCKRTLASIFQVEKQTHEGRWNFTRGMTVGRKGKRVGLAFNLK